MAQTHNLNFWEVKAGPPTQFVIGQATVRSCLKNLYRHRIKHSKIWKEKASSHIKTSNENNISNPNLQESME